MNSIRGDRFNPAAPEYQSAHPAPRECFDPPHPQSVTSKCILRAKPNINTNVIFHHK